MDVVVKFFDGVWLVYVGNVIGDDLVVWSEERTALPVVNEEDGRVGIELGGLHMLGIRFARRVLEVGVQVVIAVGCSWMF